MRFLSWLILLLAAPLLATGPALAQAPGGPPAVGVVTVAPATLTERSEFVGRIQAIERVSLTARVTAFLEKRLFNEGAEVRAGDVLYRLERGPFVAEAARQEGAVADMAARLANASIHLERAQALMKGPAGQRSAVEDAEMQQRSMAAQLSATQAQLQQARINVEYTEIRAPISGQISRTAVTPGNVVSPSTGPLATIVSQDPMYVVFPVAVRLLTDLRTPMKDEAG